MAWEVLNSDHLGTRLRYGSPRGRSGLRNVGFADCCCMVQGVAWHNSRAVGVPGPSPELRHSAVQLQDLQVSSLC